MINWKISKEDADFIRVIVDKQIAADLIDIRDVRTFNMDLTVCHLNGNPLRLADMAEASARDVAHDVFGIRRYIDRETGKLTDFFTPRFSASTVEVTN